MININDLKSMAEDIKHDFDNCVPLQMPNYKDHWRYKELLEMIDELKSGNLQDHSTFAHFGMVDDELNDFVCLIRMIQKFSCEFELYRNQK